MSGTNAAVDTLLSLCLPKGSATERLYLLTLLLKPAGLKLCLGLICRAESPLAICTAAGTARSAVRPRRDVVGVVCEAVVTARSHAKPSCQLQKHSGVLRSPHSSEVHHSPSTPLRPISVFAKRSMGLTSHNEYRWQSYSPDTTGYKQSCSTWLPAPPVSAILAYVRVLSWVRW